MILFTLTAILCVTDNGVRALGHKTRLNDHLLYYVTLIFISIHSAFHIN
jgi:hypothetical protein